MVALLSPDEARDAITVARSIVDEDLDERLALANDATGLWLDDVTGSALVDRTLSEIQEAIEPGLVVTTDSSDAQWAAIMSALLSNWLVGIGDDVTHRRITAVVRPDVHLSGPEFVVPTDAELFAGEFADESVVPADLKRVAKHHLAWSWALLEGAPGDGTDFGAVVSFDVPRRIYNLLPGRFAPGVA